MNIPENGGNTILRGIGTCLCGYTVQQTKQKSKYFILISLSILTFLTL